MLKEYLRTLRPSGPAARELSEGHFVALALASVVLSFLTHRFWAGFVSFFFFGLILALINEIRTKPRSAEEKLHLDSYKAAKKFKYKLLDENALRHVVPEVLVALESAARSALSAKQQLQLLPTSLHEVQENAMAYVDSNMRLAILAARPCMRGDEQSKKDFQALCEDGVFVSSVVEKIGGRANAISQLETEAAQYQQTSSLGSHLRDAIRERREAEAELEGLPLGNTLKLGD